MNIQRTATTAVAPAAPMPTAPVATPMPANAPVADRFEGVTSSRTPPHAAAAPVASGQPDAAYDGALIGADGAAYDPTTTRLDEVPPVRPSPGAHEPTGNTQVHVSGAWMTREAADRELQAVADATGDNVVGVYNATAGIDSAAGIASDALQSGLDKLGVGENKAVDTVQQLIESQLNVGRPIHVTGHSQGALVISRALQQTSDKMDREDGVMFDLTGEQKAIREQTLALIRVETWGGAASSYPDGPRYEHWLNTSDPLASAFGLHREGAAALGLSHPGRGAVVHEFTDDEQRGQGPILGPHSVSTYLDRRRASGA